MKGMLCLIASPLAALTPLPSLSSGTQPPLLWGSGDAPKPAQSAPGPRRWSDKASLSVVSVGGNAQSQSLGFSNEFQCTLGPNTLQLNATGIRMNTTTFSYSATGTSLDTATVTESSSTATTEAYTALARLDRKVTDSFFWFGSASWERNRASGLDNRYKGVLGLGHLWRSLSKAKFRTDYGLGYTHEAPVFWSPGIPYRFITWQLGADLERKIQPASFLTAALVMSGNARELQDWFANGKIGLTTALNSQLALKVGCELNYRNIPGILGVEALQLPLTTPPTVLGKVPYALKRLDTLLNTSLVMTF